jgi:hypothetical protein
MEPFRAPRPTCARCGAASPDHYSASGDLVCRACAALPALNARLEEGRRSGKAGAWAALVGGVALLLMTCAWGFPELAGPGIGKRVTARLVGLGIGLGLVLIVAGVRNLRIYGSKKG